MAEYFEWVWPSKTRAAFQLTYIRSTYIQGRTPDWEFVSATMLALLCALYIWRCSASISLPAESWHYTGLCSPWGTFRQWPIPYSAKFWGSKNLCAWQFLKVSLKLCPEFSAHARCTRNILWAWHTSLSNAPYCHTVIHSSSQLSAK